jgi:hypothetical protein
MLQSQNIRTPDKNKCIPNILGKSSAGSVLYEDHEKVLNPNIPNAKLLQQKET